MNEILQEIFEICVIPLLGIITTYIVKFIRKKTVEIDAKIENDTIQHYTDLLAKTVEECVIATNQVFVNVLKEQNAFTKEAQDEAFKQTYNNVMQILSVEAQECLKLAYGDLYAHIVNLIETEVNKHKVM